MAPSYPKFAVAQQKRLADLAGGFIYHAETGSTGVANDASLNMIFQTNNRNNDALTVNALAGGLALLEITENASLELAGTSEPLRNFNRVIGDASVTASVTAQGSYSNGDVIFNRYFGAEGPGAGGDGGRGGFTFILPNSVNFVATLTNLSGAATNLNQATSGLTTAQAAIARRSQGPPTRGRSNGFR